MPKKVGDYKIPFDPNGHLLSYVEARWKNNQDKVVWRDNVSFRTSLDFKGFSRGRSSAVALFKTDEGVEVQMFLKDLGDAFKYIQGNRLTGSFRFVKRGENYGIFMELL